MNSSRIAAVTAMALLLGVPSAILRARSPSLDIDRGAAGAWQAINKLTTTASLLHTTAHPDDEQGGMLALAGRKWGARTALLTLNRGEAGDNAIGPELFDALGLIRSDELAQAAGYYGLDEQYFTLAADYGFSKRLDEALEQWDRRAIVGDMVRAIRTCRPLVVVSRWQGGPRDGHGQHQAAGALTPEAVAAAGDPAAYPELTREGLEPWRVLRLYVGGVREDESWQVRVETGQYDAALGDSYANLGRRGIALERSQTSGRFVQVEGSAPLYYAFHGAGAGAPAGSFFDGLPTALADAYRLLGRETPAGAEATLSAIAAEVVRAREAFTWVNPAPAAQPLARGLALTRKAIETTGDPDVRFILEVKARQFEAALQAVLGLSLTATAEPAGSDPATGQDAEYRQPTTLAAVTPGEQFVVDLAFTNRAEVDVRLERVELGGASGITASVLDEPTAALANQPVTRRATVAVPAGAPLTRPYFSRRSIAESRYTASDRAPVGRAWSDAAFTATARYRVAGVEVRATSPILRREAWLPDGYTMEPLDVLPPVSVEIAPSLLVVQPGAPRRITVGVHVTSHAASPVRASLSLGVPDGWTVSPASADVSLGAGGTGRMQLFEVSAPRLGPGQWPLRASATVSGRRYAQSYHVIHHRGLPVRYAVSDAEGKVTAVDVKVPDAIRVGYVMGVGDELPAALTQLGAHVTLLGRDALEASDFSAFDTIVTGTRAYAVRDDLRAFNGRLLDWVRSGGNLVVLYNTPEFDPQRFAPFAGRLPDDAEEVAEERAAVTLLAPGHPLLTSPNQIVAADFEGWIEQRGSKFFSTWDTAYVPLVECHDRDQPPQRGGWLTAGYGKGHWTYMAYALHRQLPAGVPGAYRLLANLIALGKSGTPR